MAKRPGEASGSALRTAGIAGRAGYLSWPERHAEAAQIVIAATGQLPAGALQVELARELVLPLLTDRARGSIGWARIIVATAPPIPLRATSGVVEDGRVIPATAPIAPSELARALTPRPSAMPAWTTAVVPEAPRAAAKRSVGGVDVWDMTAAEYIAVQPRPSERGRSRPPWQQPKSPLRVSDSDATPATLQIPPGTLGLDRFRPWSDHAMLAQRVGGHGRAIAVALQGRWLVPKTIEPLRLAWVVLDGVVGAVNAADHAHYPWRDGGPAQDFAATLAGCGARVVSHGCGWIGADPTLAGQPSDGNAFVVDDGGYQLIIPGSRQILLTGGLQVVRVRLLGEGGRELAVTRFLLADPADVLLICSHHVAERFEAEPERSEWLPVPVPQWLASLPVPRGAAGRSEGLGVVALGCDTLTSEASIRAAAAAMERRAVRFLLGTTGGVVVRDEYAAIVGHSHPERLGLVGALAAVAAWSSVQVRAGQPLEGLHRWVERSLVLMGYLRAKKPWGGVGFAREGSTGRIVGFDPRRFGELTADGGLFRCVGTNGTGEAKAPLSCPAPASGMQSVRYADAYKMLLRLKESISERPGTRKRVTPGYYVTAEAYAASVYSQRLMVILSTIAGQVVMQPVVLVGRSGVSR